jgi:NADH:ubiquinone oxidoreductase subunit 6 (subunit J)
LIAAGIVAVAIVASAAAIVVSRERGRATAAVSFVLALSALSLILGWGLIAALLMLVGVVGTLPALATLSGSRLESRSEERVVRRTVVSGAVLTAIVIAVAAIAGSRLAAPHSTVGGNVGSTEVAVEMSSTFVVPFGVVGLVVLAALVGFVTQTPRSPGARDGE